MARQSTTKRSDPNSGDNAGVNVAIDTCAAKAEQPSDFSYRQRPFDPFNLLCKGNGWVSYISHAMKDDSNKDKLTRIISCRERRFRRASFVAILQQPAPEFCVV